MAILRPSVGSVVLLSLGPMNGSDDLEMPGSELVDISRFGADGIGLRMSAKKSQPVRLIGRRDVADPATAAVFINTTIPSLKGQVVSIIIAGATHNYWAVLKARARRRPLGKSAGSLSGGNPSIMLDCEFEVVYAGVPA